MKRSMILVAVLMISSIVSAQEKEKDQHANGERRMGRLKSELSLTEMQYASISGINKNYAERCCKDL